MLLSKNGFQQLNILIRGLKHLQSDESGFAVMQPLDYKRIGIRL